MDTGKLLEVHSKVALAFLLDSAPPIIIHPAYRQEGHWKIQASDNGQLLHTLILIGT